MTAGGHGFDGVERRGLMFVLSSPSGAGKTWVLRAIAGQRWGRFSGRPSPPSSGDDTKGV